jgi:hypothetical protein
MRSLTMVSNPRRQVMRMEQHTILENFKKKVDDMWEELYHELDALDEKLEKEETEAQSSDQPAVA